MKHLLSLLLLVSLTACAASPAAQEELDMLQREKTELEAEKADLQEELTAAEDASEVQALEAELARVKGELSSVDNASAQVRSDDRKSQATDWAGLIGAMVGLGGGAGFLTSKMGPSRSKKVVESMGSGLTLAHNKIADLEKMVAAFEHGMQGVPGYSGPGDIVPPAYKGPGDIVPPA